MIDQFPLPPDSGEQAPPRRTWPWPVGIAAAVLLVLGLVNAGDDRPETASPVWPTLATPPRTMLSTLGTSDTSAAAVGVITAARVAMPNVLGMDQQAAKDALLAAGFQSLRTEDTTGRELEPPAGWVVASQSAEDGTTVAVDTTVTLRLRKAGT
ncbi:PASTA domain-containing protein [Amycolatopsis nigrescens]|uniref:PASTA domain-containing protein n=1 Tax=Amycolatopsis nigrescens TaxID=381445 RepID=UPI0003665BA0|nr:PASTA domain-containing protein [Amycolatopsis nigrescens]